MAKPIKIQIAWGSSKSLDDIKEYTFDSEVEYLAFLKGVDSPHYSENVGNKPTILWVTVASAEGIPTTEFID